MAGHWSKRGQWIEETQQPDRIPDDARLVERKDGSTTLKWTGSDGKRRTRAERMRHQCSACLADFYTERKERAAHLDTYGYENPRQCPSCRGKVWTQCPNCSRLHRVLVDEADDPRSAHCPPCVEAGSGPYLVGTHWRYPRGENPRSEAFGQPVEAS